MNDVFLFIFYHRYLKCILTVGCSKSNRSSFVNTINGPLFSWFALQKSFTSFSARLPFPLNLTSVSHDGKVHFLLIVSYDQNARKVHRGYANVNVVYFLLSPSSRLPYRTWETVDVKV